MFRIQIYVDGHPRDACAGLNVSSATDDCDARLRHPTGEDLLWLKHPIRPSALHRPLRLTDEAHRAGKGFDLSEVQALIRTHVRCASPSDLRGRRPAGIAEGCAVIPPGRARRTSGRGQLRSQDRGGGMVRGMGIGGITV